VDAGPRARAAGLTFTAVLADAAYGDVTVFREALHRLNLPHGLTLVSNDGDALTSV
jgi:SRSO17 transposase